MASKAKVRIYKFGSRYVVGFKTKTGFGTGVTYQNLKPSGTGSRELRGTGCTIAVDKKNLVAQGAITFTKKSEAAKAAKDPVAGCPYSGWVDFAGKRRARRSRR
jgi:hypothetical protein